MIRISAFFLSRYGNVFGYAGVISFLLATTMATSPITLQDASIRGLVIFALLTIFFICFLCLMAIVTYQEKEEQ